MYTRRVKLKPQLGQTVISLRLWGRKTKIKSRICNFSALSGVSVKTPWKNIFGLHLRYSPNVYVLCTGHKSVVYQMSNYTHPTNSTRLHHVPQCHTQGPILHLYHTFFLHPLIQSNTHPKIMLFPSGPRRKAELMAKKPLSAMQCAWSEISGQRLLPLSHDSATHDSTHKVGPQKNMRLGCKFNMPNCLSLLLLGQFLYFSYW